MAAGTSRNPNEVGQTTVAPPAAADDDRAAADAPFDLRLVGEQVAEILAGPADNRAVRLSVRFRPGMPRMVVGDVSSVRQILRCFGDGAIAATPSGHVLLELSAHWIDRTRMAARLAVIATPASVTHRSPDGSSADLAAAEPLAVGMGGSVGVRRDRDERCLTRWATVQLGLDTASARHPPTSALADARIVYFGADPLDRLIVAESLADCRPRLEFAATGWEALELVSGGAERGDPVRLLLVEHDPATPDDAASLAGTIGVEPGWTATRVAAVGGTGSREVPRMARPFRTDDLIERLDRIIAGEAEGNQERPARGAGPVRVLLADDNRVSRTVVTRMLERLGCIVDATTGGRAALARWTVAHDLVLLDYRMPDMDGVATGREIRRAERLPARTPIVVMSSDPADGERERCAAAGIDDYLAKPIRIGDLRRVITTLIGPDALGEDLGENGSGA